MSGNTCGISFAIQKSQSKATDRANSSRSAALDTIGAAPSQLASYGNRR
jgi:hypothetical protein